jgi:hypothetical protein
MKYAAWMLALILVALGGNALAFGYTEWGDGYTYTCSDDVGGTYRWALRNGSYTAAITDWTWAGGTVGKLPGYISLEADFPLPMVTDAPRPWYNIALYNTEPSVTVASTIIWSDGRMVSVPVVMPTSAVPEPSGLLVFAVCATALVGIRRKSYRH